MVDLSLDLNPVSPTYKDLLVVAGDAVLTSDANPAGTNPIQQNILQRIAFCLGEWYLDNTQGLPWFQQMLVKNPRQAAFDAVIQNTILGTPGVTQLLSYSATPNFLNRTASISFRAMTTAGIVSYSGTVISSGGV
jgi:hypothetical protein